MGGKLEQGRRSVESECLRKRGGCRARRRDPGSAGRGRRKREGLREDCNAQRHNFILRLKYLLQQSLQPYRIPRTRLRSPSQCRVWCCGCCRRTARRVAGAVVVPRWGRGRGRGFARRVVSGSGSLRGVWCRDRGRLRGVWCCGRGRCAACGSPSPSLRRVGVAVAVFARRVVLWPRSLRGV